jgi:alpha-N-acetylglucosamine transferase
MCTSIKSIHNNAYVWLYNDEGTLPGIVASIHSIKRCNPNADIVVITNLNNKLLSQITTHICNDNPRLISTLLLPYSKICVLNANSIATTNIDDLFKLKTPAGPIAHPDVKTYSKSILGTDQFPIHESVIPYSHIKTMLKTRVFASSPMILSPSKSDYDKIQTIKLPKFPKCKSTTDEQLIAYYYYQKKQNFTVIHQRYNYYLIYNNFITKGDIPRILNYVSPPWTLSVDKNPHIIAWYNIVSEAIKKYKITPQAILLKAKDIEDVKNIEDSFIKLYINVSSVIDIINVVKR